MRAATRSRIQPPRSISRRGAHGTLGKSTLDPLLLYQAAVQTPLADIAFIDRVFPMGRSKRRALSLREDFAGTALMAAEWVKSHPRRTAVAIDIDAKTLHWGQVHNRASLGGDAERLSLKRGDVVEARTAPADVVVALNFSYFCLKERDRLVAYFRRARRSLKPNGLLVLDAFGGPEGMEVLEERRRVGSFTYCWEQADFDPVTNDLACHIHFRLRDGRVLKRAFSYDWRLWSLPELADCLRDAGFHQPTAYLETLDSSGRGTGYFRRATRGQPLESFVAYLVARP